MMEASSFANLEGLNDLGLRRGVDMRPTLLRVLTDLYVQKLTHTPEEERHYTELALRLLDSVDVPTRTAVAARLARHLSPPARIIQKLTADLPEVAAALRRHLPPESGAAASAPKQATSASSAAINGASVRIATGPGAVSDSISSEVADELNELFFAANAEERRLILLNLHVVVSGTAGRSRIVNDPAAGPSLEAAALARRQEDFVRILAHSLRISREQAQRIARDESGEPIVVAAKVLNVPRQLLYRILLFVNTAVGHSVERVHALATLYDEMTPQAAQDLLAVWQALKTSDRSHRAAPTRRLLAADGAGGARSATPMPRAAAPPKPQPQRKSS
jgi:hypothetical protein